MELGPLVYKILFNEIPEKLPDPNKPENIPRLKAMKQLEVERFKKFWDGPGLPLMDRWQSKIRGTMMDILIAPDAECNCKTCNKIKEVAAILKLLSEAQTIIGEKE